MTPEEFVTLRDFVCERTGIYIRDHRADYLGSRVDERLKARRLSGPRDYYYFLKYSAEGPAELQALVDLLTVQETSFFRTPEQFEALAAELPALLAARDGRGRPFRAWSAGCATGEEPATLAMLLADRIPGPFEVLATDISARALAAARAGRFPAHRLRGLSAELRDRHLEPDGAGWRLKPALAVRIEYRMLNLADAQALAAVPEQDVILCRNVFIYLSEAAKLAAAQAFHRALAPWGLLLVGSAETVDIARVPFRLRSVCGGLIYGKA